MVLIVGRFTFHDHDPMAMLIGFIDFETILIRQNRNQNQRWVLVELRQLEKGSRECMLIVMH